MPCRRVLGKSPGRRECGLIPGPRACETIRCDNRPETRMSKYGPTHETRPRPLAFRPGRSPGTYDRQRDLPRLLAMWPGELEFNDARSPSSADPAAASRIARGAPQGHRRELDVRLGTACAPLPGATCRDRGDAAATLELGRRRKRSRRGRCRAGRRLAVSAKLQPCWTGDQSRRVPSPIFFASCERAAA